MSGRANTHTTWRDARVAAPTHLIRAHGFVWAKVKGRWTLPSIAPDGTHCASASAYARLVGCSRRTAMLRVIHGAVRQPDPATAWPAAVKSLGEFERPEVLLELREHLERLRTRPGTSSAAKLAALRDLVANTGDSLTGRDLDLVRAILDL